MSNVEVYDSENLLWDEASICGFSKDGLRVQYPDNWKEPEDFPFDKIRLPPKKDTSKGRLKDGTTVEVKKAWETSPPGWWQATVNKSKGEFVYVAYVEWKQEEIVERASIRLPNPSQTLDVEQLQSFRTPLPRNLIETAQTPDIHEDWKNRMGLLAVFVDGKDLVLLGGREGIDKGKVAIDIYLKYLSETKSFALNTLKLAKARRAKDELVKASEMTEFNVDSNTMGLLIGKGGSNIQAARNIPGIVGIEINEGEDRNVVQIYGKSMDAIEEARAMLEFTSEVFTPPQHLIGRLVGKQRTNLNKIEEKSGVNRIMITESQFTLFGRKSNIKRALILLEEEVVLQESRDQRDAEWRELQGFESGRGSGGRGRGRGGRGMGRGGLAIGGWRGDGNYQGVARQNNDDNNNINAESNRKYSQQRNVASQPVTTEQASQDSDVGQNKLKQAGKQAKNKRGNDGNPSQHEKKTDSQQQQEQQPKQKQQKPRQHKAKQQQQEPQGQPKQQQEQPKLQQEQPKQQSKKKSSRKPNSEDQKKSSQHQQQQQQLKENIKKATDARAEETADEPQQQQQDQQKPKEKAPRKRNKKPKAQAGVLKPNAQQTKGDTEAQKNGDTEAQKKKATANSKAASKPKAAGAAAKSKPTEAKPKTPAATKPKVAEAMPKDTKSKAAAAKPKTSDTANSKAEVAKPKEAEANKPKADTKTANNNAASKKTSGAASQKPIIPNAKIEENGPVKTADKVATGADASASSPSAGEAQPQRENRKRGKAKEEMTRDNKAKPKTATIATAEAAHKNTMMAMDSVSKFGRRLSTDTV